MPDPTDLRPGGLEKSRENDLSQMIWGYRMSQAIFVAVKLGIIDLLGDDARGSGELAADAGADPQALHRLLVVLGHAGILREAGPARFALTAKGALLRKEGTLRDSVILAELFWPAYAELSYTIETGRSAFQRAYGTSIYEYLARNPEADAAYAARMTVATSAMAAALTRSFDFSGMRTVVDVGGGQGAFLAAILKAHPHLRGVLFERPPMIAGARRALEAERVGERCEAVAGDFFEELPTGGDAYVLKWVISEWSDGRVAIILKNCRRAMTDRGRVLVVEPLGLPSNELFNLQMLVAWNGGHVRSSADIAALFAAAGLSVTRVIPTQSPLSIVEGRPT
jgi:hypothetical protein